MDSAHDLNLLSLLAVIGTEYNKTIEFASSLLFELHEDDITSQYFVKVFLDDIELDINVLDHMGDKKDTDSGEMDDANGYLNNTTSKIFIEQPDTDSSLYYYLKRYLLRRVLTEDVENYCSKQPEDLNYVDLET